MAARQQYQPKKSVKPTVPDWFAELDLDYTSPYPCGVCKVEFRSRHELATHVHPQRSR